MLRHPVVLTTMEEDFQRLGLIQESEKKPDKEPDDEQPPDKAAAGTEEEIDDEILDGLDEEELAALAEAEAFAEEFDEEYEALGHEGEFRLDPEDMEELENLGDSVELPYGIIKTEQGDDEDKDDVDEVFKRVHKMSSMERAAERKRKRSPKAKAAARKYLKKASVQRAMKKHRAKLSRMGGTRKGYRMADVDTDSLSDAVSSLTDDVNLEDAELAIAAFANVALIAEKLYDTFKETGDEALAEGYAELAKHAASVVEFLESEEEVDMEALEAQFEEFVSVLEPGVEAYDEMLDEEDEDPKVEDEDEDDSQKKSGGEREQE